ATFTSAPVECRSGDLLALLTDGLVEVFDTDNRELGFEWTKAALASIADRPLSDIASQLLTDGITALSSTTRRSCSSVAAPPHRPDRERKPALSGSALIVPMATTRMQRLSAVRNP